MDTEGAKPEQGRTGDHQPRGALRTVLAVGSLALVALILAAVHQARGRGTAAPAEPAGSAYLGAGADAVLESVLPAPSADPQDGRSSILLEQAPPSQRVLEARVEDGAGTGIEGALVSWLRPGELEELDARRPLEGGRGPFAQRTDEGGLARWQSEAAPASGPLVLVAMAEGFQEQRVRLEEPLPRRTTVRLEPSPGIAGVVRRADGLPAGAGIRVVASPRESGPVNREVALRALEGSPLVHSTVTEADGSFRLATVRAETSYHLEAGGNGMATTGPRQGVSMMADAGASDVELVLFHLYQCLIERLDQDGNPVQSALFSMADPTSIGTLDGRLRTCGTLHGSALLAGQDPALAELPRHIVLYLFESDEALDPAGPVDLRQRTIGYAPANLEFFARPLSQEAHIEQVRLQALAAGITELTVRFVRKGEPAPSVPGRLDFYEQGGLMVFSVFWSGLDSAEPARLGSFPVGRLAWRFESTRGPFTYPGAGQKRREIDTALEKEIVIELDGTSSLLVELYEPDGTLYSGLAHMLVEPGVIFTDSTGVLRAGGSKMLSTRGPPFRFDGLPVGEKLELILLSPASGSEPGAGRLHFQLEEGAGEMRVELRLGTSAAPAGG